MHALSLGSPLLKRGDPYSSNPLSELTCGAAPGLIKSPHIMHNGMNQVIPLKDLYFEIQS